jgi:hypothetical protein
MVGKLARALSVGAIAAGAATCLRYRKDMATARAALARGSSIAETSAGPTEYAERGDGPTLLMVHGVRRSEKLTPFWSGPLEPDRRAELD